MLAVYVIAPIFIFIVAMFIAAYCFVSLACKRKDAKKYVGVNMLGPSPRLKYQNEIAQSYQWVANMSCIPLQIMSKDGLKLYARLIEHDNAKGCVLLFHGFRSSPERDLNIMIPYLFGKGYSLLLCDMRAHGKSEGNYMTYGVYESDDCVLWAKLMAERFGDKLLYLYGTSMGAATVMFACGKDLPNSVSGVIADCGFTRPWDILIRSWKRKTKISPYPLMYFVWLLIRLICGYDLRISTQTALKNTNIPILFVHGQKDITILSHMTELNYAACGSLKKRLLLLSEGEHCTNFLIGDVKYFSTVDTLLEGE